MKQHLGFARYSSLGTDREMNPLVCPEYLLLIEGLAYESSRQQQKTVYKQEISWSNNDNRVFIYQVTVCSRSL